MCVVCVCVLCVVLFEHHKTFKLLNAICGWLSFLVVGWGGVGWGWGVGWRWEQESEQVFFPPYVTLWWGKKATPSRAPNIEKYQYQLQH